jgi:hypothetical protein
VQKRLEGAGPAANQGALEATTISMPANDTELSAERGPQWSR